jgi:hypothetical protein
MGAWTYLAAWDVHRARVFGRYEVKSRIAPVNRLVGDVMGDERPISFGLALLCSRPEGVQANLSLPRWLSDQIEGI